MGPGDKPISSESTSDSLMGARLRQARQQKAISLTHMAQRLGYTKGYLSSVETGKEKSSEEVVRGYERELGLKLGELSEPLRAQRIIGPLSFTLVVALLIKSAPYWLDTLSRTLLNKDPYFAAEKGTGYGYSLSQSDEQEQLHHLELILKNAAERGLAHFRLSEEREQYRSILGVLSEQNASSERLRFEVLRLFTFSDIPKHEEFNEIYNRSLRARNLTQSMPLIEINAAPYLISFFEAFIAELNVDPFFQPLVRDVIKIRYALNMQRSLAEVVNTLSVINEALAVDYTVEQFEQDIEAYMTHIERTLHYLKLVGVVPKDRGDENIDPELNGIFVPLHATLQERTTHDDENRESIITLLEHHPYLVLLGEPGSGKSTLLRHLAWSHTVANQSTLSMYIGPLLSGKPLPLRIELRRLTEDRRQHPDYNFLSYTTEFLLKREGVEINPQMFKVLLERRTMLLLFDGLDEVATLDERQRLVEEIEHFAQSYPGNRILITTRPVGYELVRFSHQWFTHARIEGFDNEQIRQYLERWYTYVLRLSPIQKDDQEELEYLRKALQNNYRLYSLAKNPLLLTIITALHRYERLPDKRVLIYDRCADLLLDTWARLRGTNIQWKDLKMSKVDQYACVAHLGFVLHERSQQNYEESEDDLANDIPSRFLLREIERFLESQKLYPSIAEQNLQARRFLELVQVETGLIVERGIDENGESLYGFVHHTFQEYFAAADVYERYLQEEDATIISEFLANHLHAPHWHEVILLLFGKLKRKPATAQLRQILNGKIKSRRSQYTDIVQQDLFFVCDCLIEEIAVENELAELVISQLSNLVKSSPFPSQRTQALETLGELMQTRQYADLAQRELADLVNQDTKTEISTRIQAITVLYKNSLPAWVERQQAFQVLLDLIQLNDIPIKPIIQAAQTVYRINPPTSTERQQITEFLLNLIQQPDRPTEQIIKAARTLYNFNSEAPKVTWSTTKILLDMSQRPDLSIEELIELARTLDASRPPIQEGIQRSRQILLSLILRSDISDKQGIQAIQEFIWRSSHILENRQYILQILVELTKRSIPPVKQIIEGAEILYQSCPYGADEQQQILQLLLELTQRSDLSVEQIIEVALVLYYYSSPDSEKRQQAYQIIFGLSRRPNLPIEQSIQAAKALYLISSEIPVDRQYALQILEDLTQHADIPIEQIIQAAQAIYTISPHGSQKQRQAVQSLWQIAQNQKLTLDQRLQAATVPIEVYWGNFPDKARALRMISDLLQTDKAKQYINEHWRKTDDYMYEVGMSDILFLVELAQQEVLPTLIRDDLYQILYRMVPQFGNIDEPND